MNSYSKKLLVKKGKIVEILSKAQYFDNPNDYTIVYRDFNSLREMSLPEFLKESNQLAFSFLFLT